MTDDDALIAAIRDYKQADEDGIMVLVSRQACDEAAARIAALTAERDERSAWLAALVIDKWNGTDDLPVWVRRSANYWSLLSAQCTKAEAERDALREALRGEVISGLTKDPRSYTITHHKCGLCKSEWIAAEPETHASGCLAALDAAPAAAPGEKP